MEDKRKDETLASRSQRLIATSLDLPELESERGQRTEADASKKILTWYADSQHSNFQPFGPRHFLRLWGEW